MALFNSSHPGLRGRVLTKFPAQVLGTTPIVIVKQNGVYTFSWDISGLTEIGSISASDRDNLLFLVYNEDTLTYRTIAIDTLLASMVAGLDATLVGIAATAPVADQGIYFTAADTAAVYSLTVGGRALSGVTGAVDTVPYFTGTGSASTTAFPTFGRSLAGAASAAAGRTTLGLVIGTDVQAFDAELAALAGQTSAADRLFYFTGSGTGSLATFTTFGRSLVDDADAAAGLTTLGLSANAQAFLATPSSANLIALMSDETGTGANVFANTPTLVTPILGTPTSGTLTNCTGLPVAGGGTGIASGTSGGVPYFSGSTTIASSAALAAGKIMVGGGAGAAPSTTSVVSIDGSGNLVGLPSVQRTGGVAVQGTNTNDNAAAGYVGEYISASSGLVSLSTNTAKTVTSITLTQGDWDVGVTGYFLTAASTSVTRLTTSVSQTTDTLGVVAGEYDDLNRPAFVPGNETNTQVIGPIRVTLTATTIIYYVARAVFTVSTTQAFGIISARRVR